MVLLNRHILLFVCAALLLLTSCSAAAPTNEESGSICQRAGSTLAELPLPTDLEAQLDPVVEEGMADIDAVGLTVGIQCAQSPLFVKGYGTADTASGEPATADTVYEVGSVTKQFVAAMIMVLAQEQHLSIDDPIGMYLPSLPREWQSVTLGQLLSHTGGVPDHFAIFRENPDTPFDWTQDYAAADLVAAFVSLDDELVAPPGTVFVYSSTDYVILTAVIEQLIGEDFATAMDDGFFDPLGLERTAFCSPTLPGLAKGYNIGPSGPVPGPEVPASFFSGAAGICSTAGDLILWERSLVDGTAAGLEAFRAMRTPATLDDGTEVAYGLGLHLDDLGQREAIFHEGGTASFSSWLAYYPDEDLMVTVLSNTLGPNSIAIRELVVAISDVATGQ